MYLNIFFRTHWKTTSCNPTDSEEDKEAQRSRLDGENCEVELVRFIFLPLVQPALSGNEYIEEKTYEFDSLYSSQPVRSDDEYIQEKAYDLDSASPSQPARSDDEQIENQTMSASISSFNTSFSDPITTILRAFSVFSLISLSLLNAFWEM